MLGNSSTASERRNPKDGRSELLLVRRDFFVSCPLFFFPFSRLSSYLLLLFLHLIFILAVPKREVNWKTLVHEFHISIAALNGIFFFASLNSHLTGASLVKNKLHLTKI